MRQDCFLEYVKKNSSLVENYIFTSFTSNRGKVTSMPSNSELSHVQRFTGSLGFPGEKLTHFPSKVIKFSDFRIFTGT